MFFIEPRVKRIQWNKTSIISKINIYSTFSISQNTTIYRRFMWILMGAVRYFVRQFSWVITSKFRVELKGKIQKLHYDRGGRKFGRKRRFYIRKTLKIRQKNGRRSQNLPKSTMIRSWFSELFLSRLKIRHQSISSSNFSQTP